MTSLIRFALAAFVAALVLPGGALAGTTVGQLFPTNIDTTPDTSQKTGLRVDLPQPGCSTNPSDCADVAVLDTLDGFNIQPRLTIPFSGPIDLSTATSDTIFLVAPDGHRVGINQRVWAPATNTLYAESDEQLAQDTTYLLVVTRGVRDVNGDPLDATTFRHDLNFGQTKSPALKAYRKSLLDALQLVAPDDVAGASVFTTQSITAISEKIRAQLTGSAVDFNLGTAGERTVFPTASLSSIVLHRQTPTPPAPINVPLPTPALQVFPGSVGTVAFGTYSSPNYEVNYVIPPYGTATGTPVGTNQTLQFTLFVPSGPKPQGGWPTAIFGHGFTDSKDGAPWAVASTFAHNGIATIAINVVGHGYGALGTYTVTRSNGAPVTLPSGGRGVDQDGNGTIDSTEGVNAVGANTLIGNRDALRQTTIDLMQLVKTIERGIDVDGDGRPDLSQSRIYYSGQSFGGIYGVQLLGLEPDIRAGVPNVAGGPIIEIARLSPSFRGLVTQALGSRTPNLLNGGFFGFTENIPLRNQALVTATPDQLAIQTVIDDTEWAQQAGNPAAYAPHITRPVILQFARGDQTVPNPTTSAIIRAGNLKSRTTLFRNDLAHADFGTSKNPHTFLTNITGPGAPFALAAQVQIATFLASDGTVTIDPDGAAPYFETPTSMVPEDLAFIP
jgi:hypothetical protein